MLGRGTQRPSLCDHRTGGRLKAGVISKGGKEERVDASPAQPVNSLPADNYEGVGGGSVYS